MRLRFRAALALGLASLCSAPARAQFVGYTSPQSVSQTLATNVSCTGSQQVYQVTNLGQTQHYVTFAVTSASISWAKAWIQGVDSQGNAYQISDTAMVLEPAANLNPVLSASGYFPQLQVVVQCGSGQYSLGYVGVSSTAGVTAGSLALTGQKQILRAQGIGSTSATITFAAPYGSSQGYLWVVASNGTPSGSSASVTCTQSDGFFTGNWAFPLPTAPGSTFVPVPVQECSTMEVQYVSGGSGTGSLDMYYMFVPPGTALAISSTALLSQVNTAALLAEKGARWSVVSSPAAGSQASAVKAAGTSLGTFGAYHVADCVSFSGAATTAPALSALTVNLRDGGTGAGTVLWTMQLAVPAAAGQSVPPFSVCGLNLIGSPHTAMTLEFSAALANLAESVTLTGYDVQ